MKVILTVGRLQKVQLFINSSLTLKNVVLKNVEVKFLRINAAGSESTISVLKL